MLWGGGIWAGFMEEVSSGLGFEAPAAFHWFENQEGDLSGQEEWREGRWKRPGAPDPCCLGGRAWDFAGHEGKHNSNAQPHG